MTVKQILLIIIGTSLLLSACALSEATRKQASYHYQMGLSFLGENNVTRALVEFSEAEKITPDDPELLNYLGLTYYYKKKFELAEPKYLKALQLKPEYSEARNNLGVNYLEMRRWDDAILQFQKVAEDLFYQSPEFALINQGIAYYGKGDYPKSLAILRTVVSNYPRVPQGRLNLGKTYFAMGKSELAVQEYKSALELANDYADADYNLALAWLKLNNHPAAQAAFREVIRVAPDSEKGQLAKEYLNTLR